MKTEYIKPESVLLSVVLHAILNTDSDGLRSDFLGNESFFDDSEESVADNNPFALWDNEN